MRVDIDSQSPPPTLQKLVDVLHTHASVLQALLTVLQRHDHGRVESPPTSITQSQQACALSPSSVVATAPIDESTDASPGKAVIGTPKLVSSTAGAFQASSMASAAPLSPTLSLSLGTLKPPAPSSDQHSLANAHHPASSAASGTPSSDRLCHRVNDVSPQRRSSHGDEASFHTSPSLDSPAAIVARPDDGHGESINRKRRQLLHGSIAESLICESTSANDGRTKRTSVGDGILHDEGDSEESRERETGSFESLDLGNLF